MGAALAYYIALSLAPTVLILLAIASLAFGAQAAEGHLVSQIQGLVEYEGTKAIETMIEGARRSSRGTAATVLGLVTVFFATSAVVSELRDAMNTIWHVPEDTTYSAVVRVSSRLHWRRLEASLRSIHASGSHCHRPGEESDPPCFWNFTVLPRAARKVGCPRWGAGVAVGAIRVTFWGALAMAITAGVGAQFGTVA